MNHHPISDNIAVRRATPDDGPVLLSLIDALADFEKLQRPDADARARLLADAFGPHPRIETWLGTSGGVPVAYAITFESYSSFLARPTLYLEDIFVLPDYRKRRVGRALFLALGGEARRRGCGRMEWTVLDWNRAAIDFYERLGARHMRQWHLYRLTADDLAALPDTDPA